MQRLDGVVADDHVEAVPVGHRVVRAHGAPVEHVRAQVLDERQLGVEEEAVAAVMAKPWSRVPVVRS